MTLTLCFGRLRQKLNLQNVLPLCRRRETQSGAKFLRHASSRTLMPLCKRTRIIAPVRCSFSYSFEQQHFSIRKCCTPKHDVSIHHERAAASRSHTLVKDSKLHFTHISYRRQQRGDLWTSAFVDVSCSIYVFCLNSEVHTYEQKFRARTYSVGHVDQVLAGKALLL